MHFLDKQKFFNINFNKLIFIVFVVLYSVLIYRTFGHIFLTEASKEELSTIYKGMMLNPFELFSFMRNDSHPPLYYLVVKIFSFTLPKTLYGIRIISWLFYIISGISISISEFK